MRKTKEQKGITLIALIITIIVLLILAVVAIGAVQNDGIIDHAKNARDEYSTAQATENSTIQSYLDKIQEHLATGTGSGENNSGEDGGTKEEPTEPEPPETPTEPEPPEPEPPTSITISSSGDATVEQGLTRTLTAYDQNNNVIPADELEWQSSDESKVTVSNGVATGVKVEGNWVTIRATSKFAPEVYGETFITGVIEPISSIGIMQAGGMEIISETSVSVSSTVELMVCGGNMPGPMQWGCDEAIIWESGDSTIASVASGAVLSATVTGVKAGTTTITAKHPQRENVTATITITVTE